MSNTAEQRAFEAYPEHGGKRECFIKGYEKCLENVCEWLKENAWRFVALADDEHPAIGDTQAFYGTKSLLYYIKQDFGQ